jgi:hypothetical protein
MGSIGESGRCSSSAHVQTLTAWHRAVPVLALVLSMLASSAAAQQEDFAGWGYQVFDSSSSSAPAPGLWRREQHARAANGRLARRVGLETKRGNACSRRCLAGVVYVDAAFARDFAAALRSDGAIVAWAPTPRDSAMSRRCLRSQVRSLGSRLRSRARAAQRRSGRRVGRNSKGQCNRSSAPAGLGYLSRRWRQLLARARRSDGAIVGWGDNTLGQCNPPALPTGATYVGLDAGESMPWRCAATARSSRGATTPRVVQTCLRSRRRSRCSRSLLAGSTASPAAASDAGRVGLATP